MEQKKAIQKKSVASKKAERINSRSTKPKSSLMTCLIIIIVLTIIFVVVIVLGLLIGRQYITSLLPKFLPKTITDQLIGDKIKLPPELKKYTLPTISPTITETTPSPKEDISPPPDEEISETEYILSSSDTQIITDEDLIDLTPWELKVARNEIYARYGRPFVHKDLACYFAKQSWYKIDPNYLDEELSTLELKNVITILNYEKNINSPLVTEDSGCK